MVELIASVNVLFLFITSQCCSGSLLDSLSMRVGENVQTAITHAFVELSALWIAWQWMGCCGWCRALERYSWIGLNSAMLSLPQGAQRF